jgi:GGDEF domain-containing protein
VTTKLVGKEASEAPLMARLRKALNDCNAQPSRRHTLSLSMGVARFEPDCFFSAHALLAAADRALYQQKRGKGRSAPVRLDISPVEGRALSSPREAG